MELRFERPVGFVFLAGQFVRFKIFHDGESIMRSYSIASTPADPEYSGLEFCLKILPDGKASNFFKNITAGEAVEISDAKGMFVCRSEHRANKMFVATGVGLAPIISMIENELKKGERNKINLLFGVRTVEDIFWVDRLDELKNSFDNFKYQLTLSRPADDWKGLGGRVSDHLSHVDLSCEYYICGSVEMVKDVRSLLLQKGVDTKNIHFEIF